MRIGASKSSSNLTLSEVRSYYLFQVIDNSLVVTCLAILLFLFSGLAFFGVLFCYCLNALRFSSYFSYQC